MILYIMLAAFASIGCLTSNESVEYVCVVPQLARSFRAQDNEWMWTRCDAVS